MDVRSEAKADKIFLGYQSCQVVIKLLTFQGPSLSLPPSSSSSWVNVSGLSCNIPVRERCDKTSYTSFSIKLINALYDIQIYTPFKFDTVNQGNG